MQGEETGQGMVPVFHSSNHNFLQGGTDQGNFSNQVRGHGGCPVALLVPGQQIAG